MSFRTTSEPPVEGRISQMLEPERTLDVSRPQSNAPGDDLVDEDVEGSQAPVEPAVAGGWTVRQWEEASRQVYSTSTTWFEQSVQPMVSRNYAHFQSRHAPGSKYLTDYFRLRSQVFRPKTRSLIRRIEAAVAVALFSTSDLLDMDAWDDTNPDQRDAAEVDQALLQYRFENDMHWFLTMCGAAQESAIHARPIAHVHWKYKTRPRKAVRMNDDGSVEFVDETEVIEDRPAVDLVPLENLRVDPACDWRDPINSSPYCIHLMPMYVGDVKEMAKSRNHEFGHQWYRELDDGAWWKYARSQRSNDAIRAARQGQQTDPLEQQRGAPDAEIVWVYRYYWRREGVDYTYDMLDGELLMCTPRPVEDVLPHLPLNKRPYVMGTSTLEAHKAYPTSSTGMVDESQREVNELANLNIDGIRMAIMSRWLKRRGAAIDADLLKYGAANSVIQVDDVERDVRELKQQDVPASAFAAFDRVNTSFDEVSGNFSLASVANNREMNETVGGMNLLQSDAGQVKEYEIRTFVETFVEPVINQVLLLEQYYESDEQLLNDVATRTGLNLERVLDVLTMRTRVRTNVGFNSTSPERRIQRVALCVKTVTELDPQAQQGLNTAEIVKEVFGAAGFKNGSRFWTQPGQSTGDPEKDRLMQENQQLKAQLAGQTAQAQSRIEAARITVEGRLKQAAMDTQSRERIAVLNAHIQAQDLRLQEIDRQLAAGAQEIDRYRLANERDALSSEIQNERVRLMSELMGITGNAMAKKPPNRKQDGPPDLPGHDNAGTLARDRYGLIPFAEG